MGHYSHTCKLSNLPITGGTPAVLFPLVMSNKLYSNSEKSLRKVGSTYMCTNDGNHLKFIPCFFPIRGNYDDYGGIEDIIEDDGTKVLEQYFNLTIQQIANIITCNRKDDGYDSESLDCIKEPDAKDENGKVMGEEGFRDYGNPIYKERYKELIAVSGMWIHRGVYDKLTEKKDKVDEYDGIDLGTPSLLEALGFTELEEKGKDERYNRQFQKGKLIVNSDGTWINIPGEQIYHLSDFGKFCEKVGEPIENFEQHLGKTNLEQLYDYVIPNNTNFWTKPDADVVITVTEKEITRRITRWKEMFQMEISREEAKEMLIESKQGGRFSPDRMANTIAYRLLNTDGYSAYKITNPIVFDYYQACKDGKLRDVLRQFWAFDNYLFATGTFYDICGTSPQDGEIGLVKEVLDVAKELADSRYNEYYADELAEENEDSVEDIDNDEDIRL